MALTAAQLAWIPQLPNDAKDLTVDQVRRLKVMERMGIERDEGPLFDDLLR
jgi:hypothetical protein